VFCSPSETKGVNFKCATHTTFIIFTALFEKVKARHGESQLGWWRQEDGEFKLNPPPLKKKIICFSSALFNLSVQASPWQQVGEGQCPQHQHLEGQEFSLIQAIQP
jgi:hypothetical protein